MNDRNRYLTPTQPVDLYRAVGSVESNTYFGSSMALGTLYERVTLTPGDGMTVLSLVGGLFVSDGTQAWPAKVELSDKHPFEKVYFHREPSLPEGLAATEPVPFPGRAESPRYKLRDMDRLGATPHARSIDYVIGA